MAPEISPCPRCGGTLATEAIHGLCAACLASGLESDLEALLGMAEPEPPSDLPPRVPGYTLHRPLGMGGMGQVFQATCEATGEPAAVKILGARWSADPEAAARFASEARALRQLEHPGIVRVRDSGEAEDSRLYIAMELVDGCDLGGLLRAERLGTDRAFDIFTRVCAALHHAHERGIVHRDVKPSNILIGRDGTVKLADFGLAKHLEDAHSHYGIGSLTQTRDTFGTPYYIAPEILRGRAAVTPAADVYAAGVLLYHLLTGSPPLGNYTPLSQAAGLPRRIDALLAAALQDDPARRTESVETFCRSVESVREMTTRESRRRRAWKRAALAAGGLLALAGAGLSGAWYADWLNRPPPPPVFADPAAATAGEPWRNSLGMAFVPAGAPGVLFSVYETRRRDYEAFFTADRSILPGYRARLKSGSPRVAHMQSLETTGWQDGGQTWQDPGFPQSPDHPVTGIALLDTHLFCAWLTEREYAEGRLKSPAHYRLPTDLEWSAAAGLPAEHSATPRMRDGSLHPAPLPLPGNYAGPEALIAPWPPAWPTRESADAFPRTAPAGSFPALPNGLHDMGGNAAEWVDELYMRNNSGLRAGETYTVRGGSWASGSPEQIRPDARRATRPRLATADTGFRCVLDLNPEPEPEDAPE